MSLEDPDKAWLRIEEEIKNNGGKIKALSKKVGLCRNIGIKKLNL
jgi:hypothetical protein